MSVPESVAITKSNIFTQVFANIFNLINTRGNVPDPNDSSGNRKFVYSHREPNYQSRNFLPSLTKCHYISPSFFLFDLPFPTFSSPPR